MIHALFFQTPGVIFNFFLFPLVYYTYLISSRLAENFVSCTLSLNEPRSVDFLFEHCFALAFSTVIPSFFAGECVGGLLVTGNSCFESTAGDVDRKFDDKLFDDL